MEHFIKQIRESWVILAFMTMLIVWYAGVNARLTQAESDIKDLKTAITEITDLKIQIGRIDTSVEFIKQQIIK